MLQTTGLTKRIVVLLVSGVIIFPLLTICLDPTTTALPCSGPNEEIFEDVCISFFEEPLATSYDEANDFCKSKGKQLAKVTSQGQTYLIARSLFSRNWTYAMTGLHFISIPWQWSPKGPSVRGQGCYENGWSEKSELLTYSSSNIMTIDKCINFCSKQHLLYAAIHLGSFCYCSSDFIWQRPASNCTIPCSGSADQICGGVVNSAVFVSAEYSYDNWLPGHPSVFGSCLAIQVDDKLNQWVDSSCSLPLPFICEYSPKVFISNGDAEGVSCDMNACYYLYAKASQAWSQADRFCRRKGGHLATIQTQYAQNTINKLLFDWNGKDVMVWVGGSSKQWYFADGTMMEFDGWIVRNEPVAPAIYSCSAITVDGGGEYGFMSTHCNNVTTELHNRFVCSPASVIPSDSGSLSTRPRPRPTPQAPSAETTPRIPFNAFPSPTTKPPPLPTTLAETRRLEPTTPLPAEPAPEITTQPEQPPPAEETTQPAAAPAEEPTTEPPAGEPITEAVVEVLETVPPENVAADDVHAENSLVYRHDGENAVDEAGQNVAIFNSDENELATLNPPEHELSTNFETTAQETVQVENNHDYGEVPPEEAEMAVTEEPEDMPSDIKLMVKVFRKIAKSAQAHSRKVKDDDSLQSSSQQIDNIDQDVNMCLAMCRNVSLGSRTSLQCWTSDELAATHAPASSGAKEVATGDSSISYGPVYDALVDCSLLTATTDQSSPAYVEAESVIVKQEPVSLPTTTNASPITQEANPGFPWWAYLLIAAVVALGGLLVGLVVVAKKRQKNKVTTEERNKVIFISYCRRRKRHKSLIEQMARNLELYDYEVRFDSSTFRSDISMENALSKEIERADVVLVCYNEDYNKNETCCFEAQLVNRKNKPYIPIRIEQGFQPIAWLEALLGDKTTIDVNANDIDTSMVNVVLAVKAITSPSQMVCCL